MSGRFERIQCHANRITKKSVLFAVDFLNWSGADASQDQMILLNLRSISCWVITIMVGLPWGQW